MTYAQQPHSSQKIYRSEYCPNIKLSQGDFHYISFSHSPYFIVLGIRAPSFTENLFKPSLSSASAHTHSERAGCQRQAEASVQGRRRRSLGESEFERLQ